MDTSINYRISETKEPMNVYFISGLGADSTAFKRISLPACYSIHYLDWIVPENKETLDDYCKRMAVSIDQSQPFVIVGLSFGGMVATTMNHLLVSHKTILISSVANARELPPLFKWAGRLRLHKVIPTYLIDHPNFFANVLFGARSKNEKKLLAAIMLNGNPAIIKWSINAVLTWNQKSRPAHLFQIHGSNDKVLPIKYTHPDVIIKNGSHFMVWTKASEVSTAILKGMEL